jgi:hypothetical protein
MLFVGNSACECVSATVPEDRYGAVVYLMAVLGNENTPAVELVAPSGEPKLEVGKRYRLEVSAVELKGGE